MGKPVSGMINEVGFRDWKLQRISAVVMLVYVCFLFGFFVGHIHHLTYVRWHALFSSTWMQIPTLVVLALLMIHAWVGIWTVCTDYIKCGCLRNLVEFCVFVSLIAFFFWGVQILWSL